MKGFFYSRWTKGIVAFLLILTVVSSAFIVSDFMKKYSHQEEWIYGFEENYKENRRFDRLLSAPGYALYEGYFDYYDGLRGLKYNKELFSHLESYLDHLYCKDEIYYYIQIDLSARFTNCGVTSAKDLMDGEVYLCITRDVNGNFEFDSDTEVYSDAIYLIEPYNNISQITICSSVRESVVKETKALWENQKDLVFRTVTYLLIHLGAFLIFLCYLVITCGKNSKGENREHFIDRFWTEVPLCIIGCAAVGFGFLIVLLLEAYFDGYFGHSVLSIVFVSALAIFSVILLVFLLSLVRRLKHKVFLERSLLFKLGKWCFYKINRFARWSYKKISANFNILRKAISKKSGVLLIGALFFYTATIGLCGINTRKSPYALFFGVLLFLFAAFLVGYRVKDLEEIKKGAREIRNGNLSYQISEPRSDDLKVFAEDINGIGRGLECSVEKTLKSERMKTELITNVSHDLKTPLTSIINYTDLLLSVEQLPETALDYARIIASKSQRLKKLTQDLFDISKVQSGNESIILEKIDVALLIEQALGEHNREIQESGLSFCVRTEGELYIWADGGKMSRVVGNLISNILKYTMKNTRVFLLAYQEENQVVMEFKNVASYPMEFTPEEIVGRFVRGDESRTEEGNGLGLAIAKSYTVLCGGEFNIVTDGDLFKAIVRFPKFREI